MNTMLALSNAPGMGSAIGSMVLWIAVMGVLFYFMLFRPQKKQQNEMKQMLASLEVGDSVLTTSGFYGVVIDITDDTVIIEFGNNKNCRIPMQKTAITQIEKPSAE